MPDIQSVDITNISTPAFVQRISEGDSSRTPKAPIQSHPIRGTQVHGASFVFTNATDIPSGGGEWIIKVPVMPVPQHVSLSGAGAQPEQEPQPIDLIASDRVKLLAKKYEAGATSEDLARLEILTNRLQKLMPRTTAEDIADVEESADRIAMLVQQVDSLSSEYDL
jgi:hypothetical protein